MVNNVTAGKVPRYHPASACQNVGGLPTGFVPETPPAPEVQRRKRRQADTMPLTRVVTSYIEEPGGMLAGNEGENAIVGGSRAETATGRQCQPRSEVMFWKSPPPKVAVCPKKPVVHRREGPQVRNKRRITFVPPAKEQCQNGLNVQPAESSPPITEMKAERILRREMLQHQKASSAQRITPYVMLFQKPKPRPPPEGSCQTSRSPLNANANAVRRPPAVSARLQNACPRTRVQPRRS